MGLKKTFLIILTFIIITVALKGHVSGAVITDIRVGQTENVTRLVLEVNNPIVARVFYLEAPNRIVLDLPEIGWRLPARPLPKNIGSLSSIRYGLFRPGNSRLVIDLGNPSEVKRAWFLPRTQKKPFRLILDLAQVSQKQFSNFLNTNPILVETKKLDDTGTKLAISDSLIMNQKKSSNSGSYNKAEKRSNSANTDIAELRKKTRFFLAPRKPTKNNLARKRIIVVDPGHGGADPGAIGRSGTYEKHITLGFSRELVRLLKNSGRYKAILTRNRDKYIPLRKRVKIARDAAADLFISVHADSIKNKAIRGVSVYTLSETASDKEAAELAAKENKADLIFGKDFNNENPEVTNILIDLAQRETMNRSARLANVLVSELRRATHVLRRTHRFAGFRVLKAPDVPSVLLELGFLSNRQDEVNLRSKKYRRKISTAIVKSIDSYFDRIESASRY